MSASTWYPEKQTGNQLIINLTSDKAAVVLGRTYNQNRECIFDNINRIRINFLHTITISCCKIYVYLTTSISNWPCIIRGCTVDIFNIFITPVGLETQLNLRFSGSRFLVKWKFGTRIVWKWELETRVGWHIKFYSTRQLGMIPTYLIMCNCVVINFFCRASVANIGVNQ